MKMKKKKTMSGEGSPHPSPLIRQSAKSRFDVSFFRITFESKEKVVERFPGLATK